MLTWLFAFALTVFAFYYFSATADDQLDRADRHHHHSSYSGQSSGHEKDSAARMGEVSANAGAAAAGGGGGRFMPKTTVQLDPPKLDPISVEKLAEYDGQNEENPVYVCIKGFVFDVTGKDAYKPGASYSVFAGKDASCALGKSSLKPEDCKPEIDSLTDEQKQVLDDWLTFFRNRYNQVGIVEEYRKLHE